MPCHYVAAHLCAQVRPDSSRCWCRNMRVVGVLKARPATGWTALLIDRSQSKSPPGWAALGRGPLCQGEVGSPWDLKKEKHYCLCTISADTSHLHIWSITRLNFQLLPTVCKAAAVFQLSVAGSKPRGLVQQGRALLAALGPVLLLVIFSVHILDLFLVLALVLSRPKHPSEDVLIQPRLAALCDVAQQSSQRVARPPPAPENPEREKIKKPPEPLLNCVPLLPFLYFHYLIFLPFTFHSFVTSKLIFTDTPS